MPKPAGTFTERLASKLISEEAPRQTRHRARKSPRRRVNGWRIGLRFEPRGERVAQFFLEQAGYEVYLPKIRERRHRKGPGSRFCRPATCSRASSGCGGRQKSSLVVSLKATTLLKSASSTTRQLQYSPRTCAAPHQRQQS